MILHEEFISFANVAHKIYGKNTLDMDIHYCRLALRYWIMPALQTVRHKQTGIIILQLLKMIDLIEENRRRLSTWYRVRNDNRTFWINRIHQLPTELVEMVREYDTQNCIEYLLKRLVRSSVYFLEDKSMTAPWEVHSADSVLELRRKLEGLIDDLTFMK